MPRITMKTPSNHATKSVEATGLARILQSHADPVVAGTMRRFFKQGSRGGIDGDVFLGIRAAVMHQLAREYVAMPLSELRSLLASRIHEHRLVALVILTRRFERADARGQKEVYHFFRKQMDTADNWDLVDSSAHQIVGAYLLDKSRRPLYVLARSRNRWRRRVAIVSTLAFIRRGDFVDTLAIAEMLLDDPEDLMHKAVGWMLREVAKRDRPLVENFLRAHYDRVPRTTLRYAIERFPEPLRRRFLRLHH